MLWPSLISDHILFPVLGRLIQLCINSNLLSADDNGVTVIMFSTQVV